MSRRQKKTLIRIIIAAALLVTAALLPISGWARFAAFMVPYAVIGYDILKKAVKGIIKGQVLDENFLMAAATVGAIALGEYPEGVAVMLFYQIGELFQSVAVGKSRKSITALMDIRPDYANLITDEGEEAVDPDEVPVGSLILVKPGEKIPIDGVVEEGSSSLDMRSLTGESVPVGVSAGEKVISGSVNLSSVLKVRTEKEFGESTASKILELVENSGSRKSRPENFISKFARVYTPVVCISAVVLAVVPPLVRILLLNISPDWKDWVIRALTFIVISCPCALVISIPLSFFAGIGCAGKNGILIKGANYLESLSKISVMVFDKTGTLTKGTFEVVKTAPRGITEEELIEYAALAESWSPHPIAKSIIARYGKEPELSRVSDTEEISGHGVNAVIDGKTVLAGNAKLLKEQGVGFDEINDYGTVVYVAVCGNYAGSILISDTYRETSADALRALKELGVKKTVMLTGDNALAAEKAARDLCVDDVKSGLLPGDKVIHVEKIIEEKAKGDIVAFAGDGMNDAPVLSRADVGIAMGAVGSDAAIESADVVLMDDDPAKIAKAMGISKKCMRIVFENIVFAIGVKLVCLVLGALGIANMWIAIFADVGVMVLAVLNAIRAMRYK